MYLWPVVYLDKIFSKPLGERFFPNLSDNLKFSYEHHFIQEISHIQRLNGSNLMEWVSLGVQAKTNSIRCVSINVIFCNLSIMLSIMSLKKSLEVNASETVHITWCLWLPSVKGFVGDQAPEDVCTHLSPILPVNPIFITNCLFIPWLLKSKSIRF